MARKSSIEKRPTSFDDLPLVLTIDEIAPLLNVGRGTAYELVRSGQIKHILVGKHYRVLKHELRQFLGLPDTPPPREIPRHDGYRLQRRRPSASPTIPHNGGKDNVE